MWESASLLSKESHNDPAQTLRENIYRSQLASELELKTQGEKKNLILFWELNSFK